MPIDSNPSSPRPGPERSTCPVQSCPTLRECGPVAAPLGPANLAAHTRQTCRAGKLSRSHPTDLASLRSMVLMLTATMGSVVDLSLFKLRTRNHFTLSCVIISTCFGYSSRHPDPAGSNLPGGQPASGSNWGTTRVEPRLCKVFCRTFVPFRRFLTGR